MDKFELIFVGTKTVLLTNYNIEIATGYTTKAKNSENARKCFKDERFAHLYENLSMIYYIDQAFLSLDDFTKHQKAHILSYTINRRSVSNEEFIKHLARDCADAQGKYCIEFHFYETKVMLCNN